MHRWLTLLLLGHSAVAGALVAPLGARLGPSVPLTLQSPRLARPRMADPQETGRDELDEGKMKNINKAGPSEDREKELRKLMEKLKKRGAVSDSRRVVDESVGDRLAKPVEVEFRKQEGVESMGAFGEEVPAAEEAEPEVVTEVTAVAETQEKAAEQDDAQPAAPAQTTSGIGGSWAPPPEVDTHKPTKSGSWGVFERPADISKAYGGGKKIGVGAPVDEEAIARKRAETERKMEEYRKKAGMDTKAEEEHKGEIKAAVAEARQLMRYGEMRGALAQLDGIEQWCSAKTELGGNALLELGWCADACGDRPRAEAIMKKLMMNSPINDIRRKAQQLGFQKEAADFLKLRDDDDADKPSEWSQLGKLKPVRTDKRYALTDGYLASPKRKPVATLSEARMLLRSAAAKRSDGGAAQRILQALKLLREEIAASERLPPSSEAAAEQLQGEWLLGLSASESALAFAPPDAQQTFSGGSFERLAPAPLGLVASAGSFELSGEGGAKKGGALQLRIAPDSCRLGPLPLPASAADEELLYLDPVICVTRRGGSADVWVRPAAQRASAKADALEA